jgi:hypothetical protein
MAANELFIKFSARNKTAAKLQGPSSNIQRNSKNQAPTLPVCLDVEI